MLKPTLYVKFGVVGGGGNHVPKYLGQSVHLYTTWDLVWLSFKSL